MPSALITGTSTGIGLETALLFARRGYRVYAAARNPGASEGLQKGLANGLSLTSVALDVNSDESVRQCVADVGPVDVLVNNAGIGDAAPVELMPMESIRALFETNFFGTVRMMQAMLPSFRERRAGAIVNIASVMGRVTLPNHGYYTATKFALASLTETLAMEMRPLGVRVVSVEPGVIVTPIWNKPVSAISEVPDYAQAQARFMRVFGAQMEDGTPPEVVAEAIFRAATEDGPVHLPVGEDSEVWVRAHTNYEEWVSIFSEPDEQRFADRFNDLCGADVLNPPSLYARRKTVPR
jgi:NAD(P)-dependent dehydrogenase (short-subunit alcohol dehydrogenase family)